MKNIKKKLRKRFWSHFSTMTNLMSELPQDLKGYLTNTNYKRGKAALISCIIGIQLHYKFAYFKPKLVRKITTKQWILLKEFAEPRFSEWKKLEQMYKKHHKKMKTIVKQ